MDRLILSDAAWERVAPLIIGRPDQEGPTGRDNRMFVERVSWIVRTGAPWRGLPGLFGEADRPVVEQSATTCCSAASEKSWITDSRGVSWERFLTTGESIGYGDSADLGAIRTMAPLRHTSGTPQGARCASEPEPALTAACCAS